MTESIVTRVSVGDIVVIPALGIDQQHLITNTEPPGSAAPIRVDEEGRERIGLPGTLPEGLRTFKKVGHWAVERTLAAEELNGRVGTQLEAVIRSSYEQPPYTVPHD